MDRAAMQGDFIAEKWIPGTDPARLRGDNVRLLCFPFAGGGASAFAPWCGGKPWADIRAIQYPGRETRWSDPPFATIASMVEAIAVDLRPLWDRPFAFWGHSFGALVAFELTRELRRRGWSLPSQLFVSGARAPDLPPKKSIHHLPDDEFVRELASFNGMQSEIMENADLLSVLLPVIRADFRLFEEYEMEPGQPLPVPISAFGGLEDEHVPIGDLLAWASHTSSTFRPRFVAGDHFFLFEHANDLERFLQEDMATAAAEVVR
jgi:medium-chain acyl-[acyl-carrier-protein] hydrolase